MKKPVVISAIVRAFRFARHVIALRAFRARVRKSDALGAEIGYRVEYTDAEIAILTSDPDAARIYSDYQARQAIREKAGAYNARLARGEVKRARAMYLLG